LAGRKRARGGGGYATFKIIGPAVAPPVVLLDERRGLQGMGLGGRKEFDTPRSGNSAFKGKRGPIKVGAIRQTEEGKGMRIRFGDFGGAA